MISQEDEKKIEAVGWSIVCHSPFEMEHEDGGEAKGKVACEAVIKAALEEYKDMKEEEVEEAEKAKKASATSSLNLENINGREIIDFLEGAIHDEEYDLYDCSVSGFKFDSQEVNIVEYRLHFTGVFNNWGHDQDKEGQEIIINEDGITVRLGEPFEGDGSEEALEEVLTNWIKTHTFSKNSEVQELFDGILREAYQSLGEIGFENKKELKTVINKLEDAYTYMK